MTTAASLCRDPLFLSSSSSLSKSDRAAAIKIRFADIIVKSSSNKSEALMKIRREEQLLQERQLQEKAEIEARMKIRQEARLAVLKLEEEEEARSNSKFEQDPLSALSAEKELLNLIGGSRKARDRSLLKQFGLVLKTDIDDDLLQKRQLQEKERMKIRQEARLAVMKLEEEEEARSNSKFEQDPLSALSAEKELLILIGGSRKARDRSLLKQFGLVLKTDIDEDLLDDLEEGEIF